MPYLYLGEVPFLSIFPLIGQGVSLTAPPKVCYMYSSLFFALTLKLSLIFDRFDSKRTNNTISNILKL